jgi:SAM-dependent methyltransferase
MSALVGYPKSRWHSRKSSDFKGTYKFANLGCGSSLIDTPDWLNLDFAARNKAVKKTDLVGRLPIPDSTLEAVYSSHFIEHVPYERVATVLQEAHRVLKAGGLLRFVLPDFENMAREYISNLDAKDYRRSKFSFVEVVDQCVRKNSGGQLANYLNDGMEAADPGFRDYVLSRLGQDFETPSKMFEPLQITRILGKAVSLSKSFWIRFLTALLPKSFSTLNLSHAATGELHQWLWDYQSFREVLLIAGFKEVNKVCFESTTRPDLPLLELDRNSRGEPRKGLESMYIEAVK